MITPGSELMWIPTSWKRKLLAAYIDLMIFSAIWGVTVFFVQKLVPTLANLSWLSKFVVFLLLEIMFFRLWRWSPGQEFLSIHTLPFEMLPFSGKPNEKYVQVTENRIASREYWLTVLLGIIMINDGAKGLVRWSMWDSPMPLFGFSTDPLTYAIVSIILGIAEIYAGVCFLKLKQRALLIGLSLYGCGLVSIIMSWQLLAPWIAEMTMRRHAYKGLPVRPGQIEFMQNTIPTAIICWSLIMIVAMLITWNRIRSNTATVIKNNTCHGYTPENSNDGDISRGLKR